MKKFITAGLAIAMLAVPSVASANVAVENGVGFVGKGDVQTALGLANDQAMQEYFKSPGVKFTAKTVVTTDNSWTCSDGETYRNAGGPWVTTQTYTVKAQANTNNAGKLSNGWNLSGRDFAVPGTLSSTGDRFPAGICPAGTSLTGIAQVPSSVSTLYVNGAELPNTPIG